MRRDVEALAASGELARVTAERHKSPYRSLPNLPSPYFTEMLREFGERMFQYKTVLDNIQKMLDTGPGIRQFSPHSASPFQPDVTL